MDRRHFLANSIFTLGLLSLGPKAFSKTNKSLLLLGDDENQNKKLIVAGTDKGFHAIQAPSRAHEINIHPHKRNIVFGSPKWESEAYLADVQGLSVLKTVSSNKGELFYGHSIYTSDGKYLICSMNSEKEMKGFISIRDASTLSEVRRFSSYGLMPHQVRWFIQDKSIIVVNSYPDKDDKNQGHSNVCIIDVKTGDIIKKYETSIQRHSHFTLTKKKEELIICRASVNSDATLYEKILLKDGSLSIGKEASAVSSEGVESLSHVLFEEKSLALITVTGQNRLVFWDYRNNQILFSKAFDDEPRGIILDRPKKVVYVSFRKKNANYINAYEASSLLRFEFNPIVSLQGGNGSHLSLI